MDTRAIDAWEFATDKHMCTAISVARVLARNATQAFNQVPILRPTLLTRAIAQTGTTDVTERATAPHRQAASTKLL
jgi:hypothetical protein